jgi:hypothetical protein
MAFVASSRHSRAKQHPCDGIILPQGSAKEGTDRNDAALEENRGAGGDDGGRQNRRGHSFGAGFGGAVS